MNSSKYVSDFRSKPTPSVIQMKKRHKTTRNIENMICLETTFS